MMDHHSDHMTDGAQRSWGRALSEMEQWAARIAASGSAEPYLAEDPHRGATFRMETVTENGMHRVVAVSRARGRQDRGASDLAQLTEAELADVRSVVRALLDLAGHQAGRASTDIVLTATGPRIVACRLGVA